MRTRGRFYPPSTDLFASLHDMDDYDGPQHLINIIVDEKRMIFAEPTFYPGCSYILDEDSSLQIPIYDLELLADYFAERPPQMYDTYMQAISGLNVDGDYNTPHNGILLVEFT